MGLSAAARSAWVDHTTAIQYDGASGHAPGEARIQKVTTDGKIAKAMTDRPSSDLLRRLTLAAGPPGSEDAVRAIVREELDGIGSIAYDRLGSLLCEKRGTSDAPRIAIDAHLDEVGFMVQSIGDEGHLSFVALGGWWEHVLPAQRVDIVTDGGLVPGVIGATPPHFLAASDRKRLVDLKNMFIDVGASTVDEVAELGIRVGDSIVPRGEWIEFHADGVLSSKAFDNRAGVGLVCETMRSLAERDHPNTVVGITAVQEEVGCRGAKTASAVASPDAAIVLEGTPADDLPGFAPRQGVLRGGPQVRLFDPTAIGSRRLVRLVEETAAAEEIPIQLAVRRSGGTDAKSIHTHDRGVPTVVVAVPARYIHTSVSVIHWDDYTAAHRLVLALIDRLDAAAVAELTRFE